MTHCPEGLAPDFALSRKVLTNSRPFAARVSKSSPCVLTVFRSWSSHSITIGSINSRSCISGTTGPARSKCCSSIQKSRGMSFWIGWLGTHGCPRRNQWSARGGLFGRPSDSISTRPPHSRNSINWSSKAEATAIFWSCPRSVRATPGKNSAESEGCSQRFDL